MLSQRVLNNFRSYMERTPPSMLPRARAPLSSPLGAYDAARTGTPRLRIRDFAEGGRFDRMLAHDAAFGAGIDIEELMDFLTPLLDEDDLEIVKQMLTPPEVTGDEPPDGGNNAAEMRRQREPYRKGNGAQTPPMNSGAPWGKRATAPDPAMDRAQAYAKRFPDAARLDGAGTARKSVGAGPRLAADEVAAGTRYSTRFPDTRRLKV